METTETETNVVAMKGTETRLFTVAELQTINGVLGQAGPGSIKDLRLLESISKKIVKIIPKPPAPPAPPKAFDTKDEKIPSDEDKKAHQEANKVWQEELKQYPDTEVDITFTNTEIGIIKTKVEGFGSFYSEHQARQRILGLADKLGIK